VVASDIFGVSGRAMLAALVAGERDPKVLAQLARQRLRAKLGLLEEAFCGHFSDHHAFLLATMLERIDRTSADIAAVEAKLEAEIAPFQAAVDRLDEVTGVGRAAARIIIAEIGTDMGRFPLGIWSPGLGSRPASRNRQARPRARPPPAAATPTWPGPWGRPPWPRARPAPSWASATGASPGAAAPSGPWGGRPLHPDHHLAPAIGPDRPLPRSWPRLYDTRIDADRKRRNHVRQLEALGYKVTLEPAA
jgi:transposase